MPTVEYEEYFIKLDKPFKGFVATYRTNQSFTLRQFKRIVEQFKETPILTNIQYVKRKFLTRNYIAVSFETDADEAAFMLLASSGIKISYDCDGNY